MIAIKMLVCNKSFLHSLDLVSEVKLVCIARQGKDKKTERGGGTSAASKDNRGLTKVRSGGTSIRWVL